MGMMWPCRGKISMPGMTTSRHGRKPLTEPRPFSRDGVSASKSRLKEGGPDLVCPSYHC